MKRAGIAESMRKDARQRAAILSNFYIKFKKSF